MQIQLLDGLAVPATQFNRWLFNHLRVTYQALRVYTQLDVNFVYAELDKIRAELLLPAAYLMDVLYIKNPTAFSFDREQQHLTSYVQGYQELVACLNYLEQCHLRLNSFCLAPLKQQLLAVGPAVTGCRLQKSTRPSGIRYRVFILCQSYNLYRGHKVCTLECELQLLALLACSNLSPRELVVMGALLCAIYEAQTTRLTLPQFMAQCPPLTPLWFNQILEQQNQLLMRMPLSGNQMLN